MLFTPWNNMVSKQLHGILLINKEAGASSFDVLRQLKKVLGFRTKIGHAGTLDPFATGLLIVCLGRATKLVPMLMDVSKGYQVLAHFGYLTDTLDKTGTVLKELTLPNDFEVTINEAVKQLGTQYKQTPPVFSALKHNGNPMYQLAREQSLNKETLNKLVLEKARWVIIYKLSIEQIKPPTIAFSCEVSKGTYIRSLADDLAQKINLRATTEELNRIFIGPFSVANAKRTNDLKNRQSIEQALIDVEKAKLLLA